MAEAAAGPCVATARGPVPLDALGTTLMHEHVFVLSTEVRDNYPQTWGDDEDHVAAAVARLDELKAAGVDSIVDLTVIGLGRDARLVAEVAARTEIQIVMATGLYTFHDLPTPMRLGQIAGIADPLTELFVSDVVDGIAGTGVHAGILKCATDAPGVTPGVELVLRAVARAHRATGVPISTHTHAATRRGLDQQRIFAEEGVDLSRVVIGHSGDTTDLDYLGELMANGSYLGMDRFGVDLLLSFEDRVGVVAELCRRGHAGRLVLSHDALCDLHGVGREQLARAMPNWHHLHIVRDVLPALRAHGVTDDQIHTMLVVNPRAIFGRQGGY